jgi:hypothetical protein
MAKQSAADRAKRLDKGCCPIHGIGMDDIVDVHRATYYIVETVPPLGMPMTTEQIDNAMNLRPVYVVVKCMRRDCEVRGRKYYRGDPLRVDYNGPVDLLPEWEHLLAGE